MSSTRTYQPLDKHSTASDALQLSADAVSVSYGSDVALSEVTLAIKQGEFIGLVGQNGSGKTTLLRVLLGLLKPTKGTSTRHQSTIIGYVPQRGQLYNGIVPISAIEVVKLGSKGNVDVAQKALQEVGMGGIQNRNFCDLSGGQQQRVIIAKALASGANVLILDEPTTGVDEVSQSEFYTLLKKLHKENRTIVMVSHDVDSVIKLVSRVVCLNRSIVYDGPPENFRVEKHLRSDYKYHLHTGDGNV